MRSRVAVTMVHNKYDFSKLFNTVENNIYE